MAGRRVRAVSVCVVLCVAGFLAPRDPPATAAPAPPRNVESYTAWWADRVVSRTYVSLVGRGPTADERQYWTWRVLDARTTTLLAGRLMGTSSYRSGLGKLGPRPFVDAVLTNANGSAPADVASLWAEAIRNGTKTRSRFVAWVVEVRFAPTLGDPVRKVVPCGQFGRSGVHPVCLVGSRGHQRDVSVVQVPGSNIYVNRSWYRSFASFAAAARSAGFSLTASRDGALPAWMFAPGSWRSYDEQKWLYDNGYPANPPGRSMHEWGLAVDLDCDGKDITAHPACWAWVRGNGPRFGVYMFRGADDINDSEAWHVSTNGS